MSTSTSVQIESRILNEGYGPGAWHGPDLVLGITCHAVYHAGQIQLVKRLLAS
jgi:hypothetical protein